MGKLFGGLSEHTSADGPQVKKKRFSRFTEAVDGVAHTPDADKKFTRFGDHCAPALERMPPRRETAPALQQAINVADHLNSEAQIPVSILQRALPQRFSEIDQDNQGGFLA